MEKIIYMIFFMDMLIWKVELMHLKNNMVLNQLQ